MLSNQTNKIFVISGHIPHHATLLQTEAILETWQQQVDNYDKALFGWDANEAFAPGARCRRLAFRFGTRGTVPLMAHGD